MTSAQIHARNMKRLQKHPVVSYSIPRIRITTRPGNTHHLSLKSVGYLALTGIVLLGVWTKVSYDFISNLQVQAQTNLISPISVSVPKPSPMIERLESIGPKSQKQEILRYIVEKFGDDSANAITILNQCENHDFNPKAVNVNRNQTIDVGVFQVNSVHGYTLEQMSDWKQNIDAAYKIYEQAGKRFTPWTCATVIHQSNYLSK